MKNLTVEDFGLSEKEIETFVTGAQKFLPPTDDADPEEESVAPPAKN